MNYFLVLDFMTLYYQTLNNVKYLKKRLKKVNYTANIQKNKNNSNKFWSNQTLTKGFIGGWGWGTKAQKKILPSTDVNFFSNDIF